MLSHSAVCSEIRAPRKQRAVSVGQVLHSQTINEPWKAALFQESLPCFLGVWRRKCPLSHIVTGFCPCRGSVLIVLPVDTCQSLRHSTLCTSNSDGHLTLGIHWYRYPTSHFWTVVYSSMNVLRCFLCSAVAVLSVYWEILCSFAFVKQRVKLPTDHRWKWSYDPAYNLAYLHFTVHYYASLETTTSKNSIMQMVKKKKKTFV